MLKILGRKTSSNVQKVLWLCSEIGLAYEREDIGGPFGRNREPAYLKLNPNGLVPTIDDDGFVLWESNAILRYLANTRPSETVWPSDPKRRADADRWMDWQLTVLGPAITPMFLQLIRTPEPDRDPKLIESSRVRTGEALKLLDGWLADRAYVAGDAFTMGDMGVGIMTYRWFYFPVERPDLPNVKAWYDRLTEREAFRTHVMNPLV